MEIVMLTPEQQEAERQLRLNEVGNQAPCPFCQKARVRRSDYIRCVKCGVNWLDGEDISKDPRIERKAKFMQSIAPRQTETSVGALTAELSSSDTLPAR